MARLFKNGSTLKQEAYARRVWGAQGENRKHIALDVGYTMALANNPGAKIESKQGYKNAMAKLAQESNNLALKVMYEFGTRDLGQFSNKDLIASLNAIGTAWAKFKPEDPDRQNGQGNMSDKNKLRSVILQRVQHQTINNVTPATSTPVVIHEQSNTPTDDPMDF